MVFDKGLQRFRDLKIRVCDKDSIPLLLYIVFQGVALNIKKNLKVQPRACTVLSYSQIPDLQWYLLNLYPSSNKKDILVFRIGKFLLFLLHKNLQITF